MDGNAGSGQGFGRDAGNGMVDETPWRLLETHTNMYPSGQMFDVSLPIIEKSGSTYVSFERRFMMKNPRMTKTRTTTPMTIFRRSIYNHVTIFFTRFSNFTSVGSETSHIAAIDSLVWPYSASTV